MEKSKRQKLSCSSAFFYFYLIGLVAFIFIPPRTSNTRYKACFANQRVLQGAVEVYNMDSKIMMKDFDIYPLLNGHYIKDIPKKPDEECKYVGHNLDGEGYVYSIYHGDNARKIPGTYKGEKGNFGNYIKSRLEILPEAILWPLMLIIYFLQFIR